MLCEVRGGNTAFQIILQGCFGDESGVRQRFDHLYVKCQFVRVDVLKISVIVCVGKQVSIDHKDHRGGDNKLIQDILRKKSKVACQVQRKSVDSEQNINFVSEIVPE